MSKAKRPATTGKTTAIAKVVQPHGGALNAGGTPGNKGGRPASMIRATMRDLLDSEVMAQMHREWKAGKITTEDYAEFLAKHGLAIKPDVKVTVVDAEVRSRVRWMFDVVRSQQAWEQRALLEALMPVWSSGSTVPAQYLNAETR